MPTPTENLITTQIAKMPQGLKSFLGGFNWIEIVNSIAQTYNLSDEERNGVILETSLVILGLTHPSDFETALKFNTDIRGEELDGVVRDVTAEIFLPINDALKGTTGGATEMKINMNDESVLHKSGIDLQNVGRTVGDARPRIEPSPYMGRDEGIREIEHPTPGKSAFVAPIPGATNARSMNYESRSMNGDSLAQKAFTAPRPNIPITNDGLRITNGGQSPVRPMIRPSVIPNPPAQNTQTMPPKQNDIPPPPPPAPKDPYREMPA